MSTYYRWTMWLPIWFLIFGNPGTLYTTFHQCCRCLEDGYDMCFTVAYQGNWSPLPRHSVIINHHGRESRLGTSKIESVSSTNKIIIIIIIMIIIIIIISINQDHQRRSNKHLLFFLDSWVFDLGATRTCWWPRISKRPSLTAPWSRWCTSQRRCNAGWYGDNGMITHTIYTYMYIHIHMYIYIHMCICVL